MSDVEMAKEPLARRGSFLLEGETDYRPFNWKKFFFTPKYIPFHITAILIAIATALISIYHDRVVTALRPFSEHVRALPAGWLVPIAILIVISFPPLFGHELVALLTGVVYGLWLGFALVAAGTFFGEIGTWFVFKRLLREKAIRLEHTNLNYGAMARITRDGGFWIVFIIRLSVIPSHFSTAVFSTADVRFWHFALATFLTLPKQLILVYLGVLVLQDGTEQKNNRAKNILFGVAFLVTIGLAVWIWIKMRKVRALLLREQAERKAYRDSSTATATAEATLEAEHTFVEAYRTPAPTAAGAGGAYAHTATHDDDHGEYGGQPEYRPYHPYRSDAQPDPLGPRHTEAGPSKPVVSAPAKGGEEKKSETGDGASTKEGSADARIQGPG